MFLFKDTICVFEIFLEPGGLGPEGGSWPRPPEELNWGTIFFMVVKKSNKYMNPLSKILAIIRAGELQPAQKISYKNWTFAATMFRGVPAAK
jgi:hypothetical protein